MRKICIIVAGEPGPWFVPERGIHQGAPLSMPFYQIYINDLLHSLRTSTCGVMINDIDMTCPAYADDVAICALHKTGLNILLQIGYSYSKKWLFEFSIEKSVIMTWGRDQFPEISVMLGDSKLKIVEHCKHVGIELANSKAGKDRIIHEGIGKARHAILAARGIGYSNTTVSVTSLSKIYWAIAVARMAYGLEVDVIDENNMKSSRKLTDIMPKLYRVFQIWYTNRQFLHLWVGYLWKVTLLSRRCVFYGPSFVIRTRVYPRQLPYW